MIKGSTSRRIGFIVVGGMVTAVVALPASGAAASKTLGPVARFLVPQPDNAAVQQVATLLVNHDTANATLVTKLVATPRAVWLASGTPAQAAQIVTTALTTATLENAVPVFVVYNVPGRDCHGYSSGGAQTTADYEAWVDAVTAAIGARKAAVALEPDALANLPSDCGYDPNAVNIPQADSDRYTQMAYAIGKLGALANTSTYLDAGHSNWHSVGDMAKRLVQAGVAQTQGFFLNASNFQPTPQQIQYGTWISKCIYYASNPAEGGWRVGHYDYCASQYYPANPNDYTTWSLTDQWYTSNVDNAANPPSGPAVLTHFIIDTSRNGLGPNDMSAYGATPYNQTPAVVSTLKNGNWCNPSGAGVGARPTTTTANPLVDALLWLKVVGESDGQCNSAGGARAWDYGVYSQPGWPTATSTQATFDPLWGQVDPAAGIWFPRQAIQLAQLASPPL